MVYKKSVENYEIVDEEKKKSAVERGLLDILIIGAPGLLAGLSAKSKGVHVLALQFKDGKRSLIEVDDKLYKDIMKKLF